MGKSKKQKLTFESEGALGRLGVAFEAAGFTPSKKADTSDVPAVDGPPEPLRPTAKQLRVRLERKGRRGKTVTVVEGFTLPDDALASIAKQMRKALGVGAFLEAGSVVLQGDIVPRVRAWIDSNF